MENLIANSPNELETPANLNGKKAGQDNHQTAEAERQPSPNQGVRTRTANNLDQLFQDAAATAALNAPATGAAQATQGPPVVDPTGAAQATQGPPVVDPSENTAAATEAETAAQDAPETEAPATQGPPAADPTAAATAAQDAPATPGAPALQGAVGTLETTPDLEPTAAQSLQTVNEIMRGIELLATRNPQFLLDSNKTNPRIAYVQDTLTPLSWAIVKSWEINAEAPQLLLLAIHSLNLELVALCLSAGLSSTLTKGVIKPKSWDSLGINPVTCTALELCGLLKAAHDPRSIVRKRVNAIEKLLIEDEE